MPDESAQHSPNNDASDITPAQIDLACYTNIGAI